METEEVGRRDTDWRMPSREGSASARQQREEPRAPPRVDEGGDQWRRMTYQGKPDAYGSYSSKQDSQAKPSSGTVPSPNPNEFAEYERMREQKFQEIAAKYKWLPEKKDEEAKEPESTVDKYKSIISESIGNIEKSKQDAGPSSNLDMFGSLDEGSIKNLLNNMGFDFGKSEKIQEEARSSRAKERQELLEKNRIMEEQLRELRRQKTALEGKSSESRDKKAKVDKDRTEKKSKPSESQSHKSPEKERPLSAVEKLEKIQRDLAYGKGSSKGESEKRSDRKKSDDRRRDEKSRKDTKKRDGKRDEKSKKEEASSKAQETKRKPSGQVEEMRANLLSDLENITKTMSENKKTLELLKNEVSKLKFQADGLGRQAQRGPLKSREKTQKTIDENEKLQSAIYQKIDEILEGDRVLVDEEKTLRGRLAQVDSVLDEKVCF